VSVLAELGADGEVRLDGDLLPPGVAAHLFVTAEDPAPVGGPRA
jgi:hypothetical protein